MSISRKTPSKILFITGIRSEYDILFPVLSAIGRLGKMETGLVISGAHLSELYGHTADLTELDGFHIVARIESLLNSDTAGARVKSAAIQLLSLVDVVADYDPDIVVAVGDREEALTIATAGAYMGIAVAHIGGGDFAEDGNVDNLIRDAVSKMAHIHFAATKNSAERLMRLGEEAWRIHTVGAPGIDRFMRTPVLSRKEIGDFLDFDITQAPILLVIQHSISTEIQQADQQMRLTLEAVSGLGVRTLVSYPNSDAGSQQIIKTIKEFESKHPQLKSYRNLPRDIFVNLLKSIDVLVGNSSCGIIEAPVIKLPVVNIGKRQVGREHAENVLFVDHNVKKIQEAIKIALHDQSFRSAVQHCQNPYGDGNAGESIAEILCTTPIDERLLMKRP